MIWSSSLAGTSTSAYPSTRKVLRCCPSLPLPPFLPGLIRKFPGYSGVAIYTKNSICSPIRAEEGITGILTPPASTTSFRDLPQDQQIGGYPKPSQLSGIVDEATLDSEGRCVILEFPAFVLIGTYSPATRDETRDDFRHGYLEALDVRIRNLVGMGKRVVLTGDLNVIRDSIDTAGMQDRLKKDGVTAEEFFSTPARRLFNQLIFQGNVLEPRDAGKEKPVLWDLGRLFNPTRQGMYTCWETKKNMRPGNFGSRIDYVLCSDTMKQWFVDSNIQEGLMGSDHCPVFATIGDRVQVDGKDVDVRDLMNPAGVFQDGVRQRDWTVKDLLPMSAKLIPEFDRRQSIKDMFFKKPAAKPLLSFNAEPASSNQPIISTQVRDPTSSEMSEVSEPARSQQASTASTTSPSKLAGSLKRSSSATAAGSRVQKKAKAESSKGSSGKGQSSLMGFFKPKATQEPGSKPALNEDNGVVDDQPSGLGGSDGKQSPTATTPDHAALRPSPERVIDQVQSKESWSKLLGKRIAPKCEHGEDCISLVTKKAGVNRGPFQP